MLLFLHYFNQISAALVNRLFLKNIKIASTPDVWTVVSAQRLYCCIYMTSCFVGDKREEREDGILFNNEDEKEQWEEDQRVSALLKSTWNPNWPYLHSSDSG